MRRDKEEKNAFSSTYKQTSIESKHEHKKNHFVLA